MTRSGGRTGVAAPADTPTALVPDAPPFTLTQITGIGLPESAGGRQIQDHPGIKDSYGILVRVRSPLETFAGMLDRSVQEIAALAADARTVDLSRISRIADIWDNNTFPLVSAACAPRLLRTGRARAGLGWMAGLGAARRELTAGLDPGPAHDWRHRGMGKGPVSERDLNSHVCDLRLRVPGSCRENITAGQGLVCVSEGGLESGKARIFPILRLSTQAGEKSPVRGFHAAMVAGAHQFSSSQVSCLGCGGCGTGWKGGGTRGGALRCLPQRGENKLVLQGCCYVLSENLGGTGHVDCPEHLVENAGVRFFGEGS